MYALSVSFRGFYGEYEIEAETVNGTEKYTVSFDENGKSVRV